VRWTGSWVEGRSVSDGHGEGRVLGFGFRFRDQGGRGAPGHGQGAGAAPPQYKIAGWLPVIGVWLWAITRFANRGLRGKKTYLRDPEELSESEGTVN